MARKLVLKKPTVLLSGCTRSRWPMLRSALGTPSATGRPSSSAMVRSSCPRVFLPLPVYHSQYDWAYPTIIHGDVLRSNVILDAIPRGRRLLVPLSFYDNMLIVALCRLPLGDNDHLHCDSHWSHSLGALADRRHPSSRRLVLEVPRIAVL